MKYLGLVFGILFTFSASAASPGKMGLAEMPLVQKLENGIEIELKAKNAETLEKMHRRADNRGQGGAKAFWQKMRGKDARISVEKTETGLRIRRTFTDSEKIEKWHRRADFFALQSSMERSIENVPNGVQITILAESDSSLQALQKAAQNLGNPRENKKNILREIKAVDRGIQIQITSPDPEIVEKIQNFAASKN